MFIYFPFFILFMFYFSYTSFIINTKRIINEIKLEYLKYNEKHVKLSYYVLKNNMNVFTLKTLTFYYESYLIFLKI